MTNIDDLCKILKAYEEGKTIQCKYEFPTSTRGVLGFDWRDIDPYNHCVASLMNMELRIKPEPREIWVVIYRDESTNSFFDKASATDWASDDEAVREIVRFREVLDDE